jgi:small-conductance mechanosensitive channel
MPESLPENAVTVDAPAPAAPLEAIEVLPQENPQEQALAFFDPDAVLPALLLLLAAVVVVRLIHRTANGLAERLVAHRLLIKQVATLLGFLVYGGAAGGAVAMVFELSTQALLAVSGTLALVAGFLLKDVAESFVAGMTILTTRPFSVGDRIHFGGYYGEVCDIGLRTVQMVTLDDNLVTVPSSKFLTESVASANAGALACMVVMPFYVSGSSDH